MQVAQLRVSRDKLLAELEKQFLEVDRLSVENSALAQVILPSCHATRSERAESWDGLALRSACCC